MDMALSQKKDEVGGHDEASSSVSGEDMPVQLKWTAHGVETLQRLQYYNDFESPDVGSSLTDAQREMMAMLGDSENEFVGKQMLEGSEQHNSLSSGTDMALSQKNDEVGGHDEASSSVSGEDMPVQLKWTAHGVETLQRLRYYDDFNSPEIGSSLSDAQR